MARYITFRFDDGYIAGARRAAELLLPSYGSFFIVTDWVESKTQPERGDLDAWKSLAAEGSDIQPHGKTHTSLLGLSSGQQADEIKGSIDFVRKIQSGPYIFCCPYNNVPLSRPLVEGLSAFGFYASQPQDKNFNLLNRELDVFRLQSWDVDCNNWSSIPFHLDKSVPDGAWVVLGLHSLNGEGYEPLTSDQLTCLVYAARGLNYEIATAAEMFRSGRI
jgi:peptidoglycan/xylan/chitin deacetylase (PgdA/CDA1 family)